MKLRLFHFLYLLLFWITVSNAQRTNAGYTDYTKLSKSNNNPNIDSFNAALDSLLPEFQYRFYYLENFTDIKINGDTTLDKEFKETEPNRRKTFYDLNTGNAGSAITPSIFTYKPKAGFHSGYNQYDVYNYSLNNFKFYDSERTLADLRFAFILGSQNNFIVGADFGQKFKSGISMSMNYSRISQLGSYNQQSTKSTSFGIAFRLETLRQRLNLFTGLISNTNNEQHNGGIKNLDDILIAQFKGNIQTQLDNANTRFDYKDLFIHLRYNIDGKNADNSVLALGYHFQYQYGYNKFSDVGTSDNQSFYKSFWVDNRGIRNINNIDITTNEFYLASKSSWADAKISLVYDNVDILQESKSNTINDLSIKFNGLLKFWKTSNLNTKAVLGLGNNAGTFTMDGDTKIRLGKWADLSGSVSFYRSQIPWRHKVLRLNDEDNYVNEFAKPFGSTLHAGIKINPIRLEVTIGQTLINNYLYFDTISRPSQLNGLFSNNFISATHKLKVWKIGLENDYLVQNFNVDILALPSQILRSNLFLENYFFNKNLLLRVGVEARYLPQFSAPLFNPVLGNYYKSDAVPAEDYIMGDLYILGQVTSRFRIQVKWENAQQLFMNKTSYLSYRHPQFDTYIKLGFRWLLLD
jgi:hypothetical protein